MNKSESINNIVPAIISVMQDVKGIEKSMTVGTGQSAYQGVPDKEVKQIIGDAMQKHGLCIVPTSVTPKLQIDRWEETSTQYGTKMKQSAFTEVDTKYLLMHTSGEWIELSGYGHGVDSQDKGAGKATTYALKYTLLYTFLVPTGKIDDSDNTHSNDHATPQAQQPKSDEPKDERSWLNKNTQAWENVVIKLKAKTVTIADVEKHYKLSKAIKEELTAIKP